MFHEICALCMCSMCVTYAQHTTFCMHSILKSIHGVTVVVCLCTAQQTLKMFLQIFFVDITTGAMNSSRYKKQVEQAMKTKHTHTQRNDSKF